MSRSNHFLYDWQKDEWQFLDDIPNAFFEGVDGIMNDDLLGPEILAAEREFSYVFSLTDFTWREGPPLPYRVSDSTPVQLADSNFSVGGYADGDFYGGILQFVNVKGTYEWIEKSVKLNVPRRFPSIMSYFHFYVTYCTIVNNRFCLRGCQVQVVVRMKQDCR